MGTMSLLAWTAASAPPVRAEVWCDWAACDGPLQCLFDFCWCEGTWDDSAAWDNCASNPSSTVGGRIQHFNRSTSSCSADDAPESWTRVNAVNDTFKSLYIFSECSDGGMQQGFGLCTPETFRLVFWGSGTLTSNGVIRITGFDLDHTSSGGNVIVEVGNGAAIQTQ
jgi:hypothetical protein